MPILPGYWPGDKYNPRIYRGLVVEKVGGKTIRFKFQPDVKQVNADGTVEWVRGGKLM